MGNGIAHTFAQSGFTVKNWRFWKIFDKGMATIAANLDRMISKGVTEEDAKNKYNYLYWH
jgi:3-hydroxybutyryl-CoA dehydrogenase